MTQVPAKKKTSAKKDKASGSNYKDWDQCSICKRHIAKMDEHTKAHRNGTIDERGKRTDKKGYKPGAPKKAKAKAKKPAAKKVKAKKAKAPKQEAEAAPAA